MGESERSDRERRWRQRRRQQHYLFNRLRSILHRYWEPVLAVSTTGSVRGRDKRRIMESLARLKRRRRPRAGRQLFVKSERKKVEVASALLRRGSESR